MVTQLTFIAEFGLTSFSLTRSYYNKKIDIYEVTFTYFVSGDVLNFHIL